MRRGAGSAQAWCVGVGLCAGRQAAPGQADGEALQLQAGVGQGARELGLAAGERVARGGGVGGDRGVDRAAGDDQLDADVAELLGVEPQPHFRRAVGGLDLHAAHELVDDRARVDVRGRGRGGRRGQRRVRAGWLAAPNASANGPAGCVAARPPVRQRRASAGAGRRRSSRRRRHPEPPKPARVGLGQRAGEGAEEGRRGGVGRRWRSPKRPWRRGSPSRQRRPPRRSAAGRPARPGRGCARAACRRRPRARSRRLEGDGAAVAGCAGRGGEGGDDGSRRPASASSAPRRSRSVVVGVGLAFAVSASERCPAISRIGVPGSPFVTLVAASAICRSVWTRAAALWALVSPGGPRPAARRPG